MVYPGIFVTGSEPGITRSGQGKMTCDMSAIPGYEWARFSRFFYLVTPETILLEFFLVSQGFSNVSSILEIGFKLPVIAMVCSKMYSTKK